jgi:hypothetical protein
LARPSSGQASVSMECDKQDKNGEGTLFWKDIWMGKVPIKIKYPRFFDIYRDKDVPVSECCERGEWSIDLVRPLNDSDCCLWEELHTELRDPDLGPMVVSKTLFTKKIGIARCL